MTDDDDLDFLAVASDDIALGRLAAGQGDDGGDLTLDLLAALRSDLDLAAAAVDAASASVPSAAVGAVVPIGRRRGRPWFAVLTAAAAVGVLAGAVVAQDRPGQVLYPVRRAILGDAVDSVGEVSALLDQASAEISRARRTLSEAPLDRADELIDEARRKIGDIGDPIVEAEQDRRADALEDDLDDAEELIKDARGDRDGSGSGAPGSDDPSGSDDSGSSGSGSDDSTSGSGTSGSGTSGSGSDDSTSGSGTSGSGSSGSGSDDSTSGSGTSGSGSGTSGCGSGTSGSGHD
jgi:hypothetical protein